MSYDTHTAANGLTRLHMSNPCCFRYSSEAALGLLADALEEAAGLQQLHWQVLARRIFPGLPAPSLGSPTLSLTLTFANLFWTEIPGKSKSLKQHRASAGMIAL